jgi:hypothetical protein
MVLNGICPFSLEFLDFTWTLLLKKKNARKFVQQQVASRVTSSIGRTQR